MIRKLIPTFAKNSAYAKKANRIVYSHFCAVATIIFECEQTGNFIPKICLGGLVHEGSKRIWSIERRVNSDHNGLVQLYGIALVSAR